MTESYLDFTDVSYAYRQTDWTLRPISHRLLPGSLLGIIGPNGAGKSTLLKIAAGIIKPATGVIELLGRPLTDLTRRALARQLAYLPQNVTSTFDYTVEQVVALGRFPHLKGTGFLQSHDVAIVNRCLADTDTENFRHRPISQLSGGQRQRVLLASVLAQQPQVLLLDEPTNGLDLYHQATLFSLLKTLAGQGIAIIVVTHDLNLAALYCDRLLLLQDGSMVRQGSIEQVICQEVLGPIYHETIRIISDPQSRRPIVLPNADAASSLVRENNPDG